MKAIILAAGKGERMKPLTNHTPKPLLNIGDKSILEWHLHNLIKHGFKDITINNAWLGQQIVDKIGFEYLGAKINHSSEPECLETAGGIAYAMQYLSSENDEPFLVINGDTFIPNLPIQSFMHNAKNFTASQQGYLYLVDNPPHNSNGDFYLDNNTLYLATDNPNIHNIQKFTFSGMGLYRPSLFNTIKHGEHAQLSPVLRHGIINHTIFGEKFNDVWRDIGTVQRLQEVNEIIKQDVV